MSKTAKDQKPYGYPAARLAVSLLEGMQARINDYLEGDSPGLGLDITDCHGGHCGDCGGGLPFVRTLMMDGNGLEYCLTLELCDVSGEDGEGE